MIAYDASSGGSSAGNQASLTFSHTCTGSDRILFVGISTTEASSSNSITGVTYNGVAMTLVNTRTINATKRTHLYYLVNPNSGANNVVISVSPNRTIRAYSASYTGAKQTGQPDASATAGGTATDPNITISPTVITTDSWLVGFASADGSVSSWTQGINTTLRASDGSTQRAIFDSNGPRSAGSQSIAVNAFGSGLAYAGLAAAFSPSATPSNLVSIERTPVRGVNRGIMRP